MSKRSMPKFRNPLLKAVSYAESKLLSLIREISRLLGTAAFAATPEGADSKSDRIFWFLNLVLFVSLILLSPDKVTQVLATARSGCTISDGFQDVVDLLRKLAPF